MDDSERWMEAEERMSWLQFLDRSAVVLGDPNSMSLKKVAELLSTVLEQGTARLKLESSVILVTEVETFRDCSRVSIHYSKPAKSVGDPPITKTLLLELSSEHTGNACGNVLSYLFPGTRSPSYVENEVYADPVHDSPFGYCVDDFLNYGGTQTQALDRNAMTSKKLDYLNQRANHRGESGGGGEHFQQRLRWLWRTPKLTTTTEKVNLEIPEPGTVQYDEPGTMQLMAKELRDTVHGYFGEATLGSASVLKSASPEFAIGTRVVVEEGRRSGTVQGKNSAGIYLVAFDGMKAWKPCSEVKLEGGAEVVTATAEPAASASASAAAALAPAAAPLLNPIAYVLYAGHRDKGSILSKLPRHLLQKIYVEHVRKWLQQQHINYVGIYASVVSKVDFPTWTGNLSVNMMPIILGNTNSVPSYLRQYVPMLAACPIDRMEWFQIGYLTIHESIVMEDQTSQRRKGVHTETPGMVYYNPTTYEVLSAADGKTSSWSIQNKAPMTVAWGCGVYNADLSINCKYNGGLYMASNVDDSTKVWNCQVRVWWCGVGRYRCSSFFFFFVP